MLNDLFIYTKPNINGNISIQRSLFYDKLPHSKIKEQFPKISHGVLNHSQYI